MQGRSSVPGVNDELSTRLCGRTLELVDIPSPSRSEAAIAAHVLAVLEAGGVPAVDAGDDCVVAGTRERGDRPLVLLAGHLDTVPAQDNIPGMLTGDGVAGLGAADMKGSLAVMIELALADTGGECDLGYLFFGREELPPAHSSLVPLLEREPGIAGADLVLMMEPTANRVQAGCLGNLNATWSFSGESGHSARPWLAENAIAALANGVAALEDREPVDHTFDGLTFREVFSVTSVEGGVARNVIPGRATAHVNYRYPPGIGPAEAEERLREACAGHGELEIEGNAPSGEVYSSGPLVERLVALSGGPVEPKQAWTPVAEFGAASIPAVNFGPGDPAQAHRADESVGAEALVTSYEAIGRLATGGG